MAAAYHVHFNYDIKSRLRFEAQHANAHGKKRFSGEGEKESEITANKRTEVREQPLIALLVARIAMRIKRDDIMKRPGNSAVIRLRIDKCKIEQRRK